MRGLRMLIVALMVAAAPAFAGPLDDAYDAYARGDYAVALQLFRSLAINGDAKAQYNLALMYNRGEGIPRDAQQAIYWYKKAAEQGEAKAQVNLGFMYDNGVGVVKDAQQAVYWYRKAAEQGEAKAQFNLGAIYANGIGLPKNYQQAYFWFLLASVSEDAASKKYRDLIEARLTPQERAAAQAEARTWKPLKP